MPSYTVRLLHVSDTHLGIKPYGLLDREKDVYDAFMEVVEIAKSERVDAVLHAGDMFDKSTPRPATLMVAVKGLRELAEREVKVYVSPGNHEHPRAVDEGSPVRLLELVGLLKGPDPRVQSAPTVYRLGSEGRVILAVFPPTATHALRGFSMEKKRGEFLIALAHVRLCDALRDAEGVPLEKCSSTTPIFSSDIAGNVDYAALGDLHETWEGRLPGGGKAVYPGATEHFAVDEYERSQGRRLVYLLRVEDGVLAELKRVELKSVRPWVVLRAPYSEVVRALDGFRRSGGKPPLLYVEISDPVDRAKRERLVQRLKALAMSGEILDYVLHARQHSPEEVEAFRRSGEQRVDVSQLIAEALRTLARRHSIREECVNAVGLAEKLRDFVLSPSDEKARQLVRDLENAVSQCG
ncbi:MAG: exonuclease SbcCD subunit D [Acidilobaceae archaeon]